MIGLPGAIAFVISAGLTGLILHPWFKLHLIDHPNERSLHETATLRGGGIAIVLAISICSIVLTILFPDRSYILWIGACGALVAGISFLDDRYDIRVFYRFLIHVLAGSVLLYNGFIINGLGLPGGYLVLPVVVATVITLLFIVWMTNLYNFMDGMDGFAGGMAVIGFGAMAALGLLAKQPIFAGFNIVIAGAAAGFLVFNFPPARIFMGDTGSSTLGFLAAACALWGDREQIFPLWVAVLIFSPFIVDATVTLIRRVVRGDRIWQAHRGHYYQRLVLLGWGHRKTVLWEYLLMLLSGGSALIVIQLPVPYQWLVLAGWTVLYFVLILSVGRLERYQRVA